MIEQRELCRIPSLLGPEVCRDVVELETELSNVYKLSPTTQPMFQLVQCNVGLCIFRRVRALGHALSDESLDLIVGLARRSLKAAEQLVRVSSPWWHIINIPFQIVCVLLVIDHPQALVMLPDALQTLRCVADHYKTGMTREEYEIALFL